MSLPNNVVAEINRRICSRDRQAASRLLEGCVIVTFRLWRAAMGELGITQKKPFPLLLLLCIGFALTGCSAIGSRVVGGRYFSGVRTDYAMCFDRASIDPNSRIHPGFAVVDVPFSLVGDVLFLPYDVTRGGSQVDTNSLAASHE